MWFFKRREVYHGFELKRFSEVRDTLKAGHIKYDYRIINHNKSTRARSSFGINSNFELEYYIYVSKQNLEEAMHLINGKY